MVPRRFVVDSPVFPDELDALPAILGQAGWPLSGLLSTHGDWDHVLGRLVFPDASLGVAETTAARLRAEPGDAQRSLREFDDENYVERPRPLSLGSVQALPVPGTLELGDAELELLPADGHTHDGMAIWIPWAGVLVCGDYLLAGRDPWLRSTAAAAPTWPRWRAWRPTSSGADWVVPGHGVPLDSARAPGDHARGRRLPGGAAFEGRSLPLARRSPRQRRLHSDNVAKVLRGQG